MALIKCRECGKEISDQAQSCPGCGCPVRIQKPQPQQQRPQLKPGETILNGVILNPKEIYKKNNYSQPKTSEELIKLTHTDKATADMIAKRAAELVHAERPKVKGGCLIPVLVIILFFAILSLFAYGVGNNDKGEKETAKKPSKEVVAESTSEVQIDVSENKVPEESEEDYKASCSKDFKYKDVLRNPENYVGQRIVIDVKVSSVHKEGLLTPVEYYFARANDEYDWWLGDEYGVFNYTDRNLKILDDDVIRVWGEISEPQETASIIVNSEELFCIDMKYVELISE